MKFTKEVALLGGGDGGHENHVFSRWVVGLRPQLPLQTSPSSYTRATSCQGRVLLFAIGIEHPQGTSLLASRQCMVPGPAERAENN